MARDKDRTPDRGKDATPAATPAGLPGDTIRFAPNGDYTHGHPGLPPKDDKPAKEGRR